MVNEKLETAAGTQGRRLITAAETLVKVKKVTAKGALLLIYKDARFDMSVLDELYGPFGWQCDYKTINGVLYCGIAVRHPQTQEWVWKWDCGIESRPDGEGTEKKGEASDAFKRAGFRWGIGRELYTAPFIFARLETVADGHGGYKLKNPFQKFFVTALRYDSRGEIAGLRIRDDDGKEVFSCYKDSAAAVASAAKRTTATKAASGVAK